MKFLRPLHRQRSRRRNHFIVLGNEDLAAHYGAHFSELESYLTKHNLPFHKDSCANIWASCERDSPKRKENYRAS